MSDGSGLLRSEMALISNNLSLWGTSLQGADLVWPLEKLVVED